MTTAADEPVVGVRELRKRRIRAALLAAAEDLFGARGFEQVTVAEIAAAAGVSVKTLFQYFRSKEDLLFGDAAETLDGLLAALTARPRDEPPVHAVTRWLLNELEREADPDALERYHRMIGSSPAVASRLRRMWEEFEEAVARVLADEANEAVPAPQTRLVAAQLITMIRVVTSPEVREFVARAPAGAQLNAVRDWIRRAGQITGEGLNSYIPGRTTG
jgi:AcrR family transcriptional regulator